MKGKKWFVLAAAMLLLGSGVAYASTPWGEFQGFTKIKVQFNNNELATGEVPGFVIANHAVVPLRAVAESMQALVDWDDAAKTANIYKPNVHMFIAKEIGKDDIKTPFGKVKMGDTLDFVVFAQVDSLTTPIHSFRVDIVSPSGIVVRSSDPMQLEEQKESFWYQWPVKRVTFDEYGPYKVRFLMKLDELDDYTVVSEKTITSG